FVYWEDTDWSARAISGGHTLLYVPSARLFHLVSSSLGVRSASYIYYNIRNHFIFIRHNINGLYKWLARFSVLYIAFKYLLNISLRYKKDRAGCFKAVFYGLADGITKRSGKLERSL